MGSLTSEIQWMQSAGNLVSPIRDHIEIDEMIVKHAMLLCQSLTASDIYIYIFIYYTYIYTYIHYAYTLYIYIIHIHYTYTLYIIHIHKYIYIYIFAWFSNVQHIRTDILDIF